VEHDLMGFFLTFLDYDILSQSGFFPGLVGTPNSRYFSKFQLGNVPHSFKMWWCLIYTFNISLKTLWPACGGYTTITC